MRSCSLVLKNDFKWFLYLVFRNKCANKCTKRFISYYITLLRAVLHNYNTSWFFFNSWTTRLFISGILHNFFPCHLKKNFKMSHWETFQFLCNRRMFTLENESIWIQYLLRSHYLPWGWYCEGCTLWCSEKMVALEMPDGLNNRVKIMPWGRGCHNVRPEKRFIYERFILFVKWRENEFLFMIWPPAPFYNQGQQVNLSEGSNMKPM